MDETEAIARLREMADPAAMKGRARFGLPEEGALGVRMPEIRALAREAGKDAALARALWRSGIHEARLLATLTMPPEALTRAEAERWLLADVRSWDLCDAIAMNVADRAPWAASAAKAWAARPEEWLKRGGFAIMAAIAVHNKKAPDASIRAFLPVIERSADDERNYVRKGASWALRQIGKRSAALRRSAIASARRLATRGIGARWVSRDTLRELEGSPRSARLKASRRPSRP